MFFHTAKVMSYLEFSQLFSKKQRRKNLRLRFLVNVNRYWIT